MVRVTQPYSACFGFVGLLIVAVLEVVALAVYRTWFLCLALGTWHLVLGTLWLVGGGHTARVRAGRCVAAHRWRLVLPEWVPGLWARWVAGLPGLLAFPGRRRFGRPVTLAVDDPGWFR